MPRLLGRGGVLGEAVAAVELPGRGEDLVGAAGARGRVDGGEVAARLAHDDRVGDRPVAEPLLRPRPGPGALRSAPGAGPPWSTRRSSTAGVSIAAWRWARRSDSCAACGLGLARTAAISSRAAAIAIVVLRGALLGVLNLRESVGDRRRGWRARGDERGVGLLDAIQVLGSRREVVEAVGLEDQGRCVGHAAAVDARRGGCESAWRERVSWRARRRGAAGTRRPPPRGGAPLPRPWRARPLSSRLALRGVDRLLLGGGELRRWSTGSARRATAPPAWRRRSSSCSSSIDCAPRLGGVTLARAPRRRSTAASRRPERERGLWSRWRCPCERRLRG